MGFNLFINVSKGAHGSHRTHELRMGACRDVWGKHFCDRELAIFIPHSHSLQTPSLHLGSSRNRNHRPGKDLMTLSSNPSRLMPPVIP